jgi:hypothetical protein
MESVFRKCGVEGEERGRGYRKAVVLLFLFSDALDIISNASKKSYKLLFSGEGRTNCLFLLGH